MNNTPDNPTWFLDRLTLYQAAKSTPEAIKRNFLIRIAEFELIVSELRRKKPGDPVQHELILGRRGSGKSTLLRRIQIEIDEDAELSERYIAINLAEEQAAIYRLSDLWFEVLQELMVRFKERKSLRDFDDFEDEDGCPDPDNDQDGILDEDDQCPNDPETKNGFKDEDGCPDDTSNDRDGDGMFRGNRAATPRKL